MYYLSRFRCLSILRLQAPCTSTNHIKQLHAQLLINGLDSLSNVAKLVELYSAAQSRVATLHARRLVSHFHQPSVYLLNVLIRCALPSRDSIFVFADWVSNASLVFDDFTYVFVLGACARFTDASALWEGKQIHTRMLKHGFSSYVTVQTTGIRFYARNGKVGSARKMFDEMTVRSVVSWNAMINGYCLQIGGTRKHACEALVLFCNMLGDVSGVKPTDITLACVVSAASQLGVLESGACVHGFVEKAICCPENDIFIGTGLVDMYSKCGCLESALCIFGRMREKNVLTWTAMTTGLAVHGKGREALELLDEMAATEVKPNAVTFTSLLSACCHAGLVEEGLCLFNSMETKFSVLPLIQHYSCIVDLLGRAGHLMEAFNFINGMRVEPDAVLWRSLLNACNVHGDVVMGEKVGKVLLRIQPRQIFVGKADTSEDFVALSNVYASAERWEEVEMVRESMRIKGIETKPGSSLVCSQSVRLSLGKF